MSKVIRACYNTDLILNRQPIVNEPDPLVLECKQVGGNFRLHDINGITGTDINKTVF